LEHLKLVWLEQLIRSSPIEQLVPAQQLTGLVSALQLARLISALQLTRLISALQLTGQQPPQIKEHAMLIWVAVPFLVITLVLLLRAEERTPRDERQVKLWKPLSTVLVILVCALSLTRSPGVYDIVYTLLIAGGLTLSLAGDVLLIPQNNPRAFLGGLVAFLLAHVLYVVAFVYVQISLGLRSSGMGEAIAAIGLAVVGSAVYHYFSAGLGKMRLPVILYVLVISVMVHRALAVALVYNGPATQPALMVGGGGLFYLSDAILAINKFRFDGQLPHYRRWNLSTYYAGQLLIALSASFFK
jgi:uncharacterized membrane protein YhhN